MYIAWSWRRGGSSITRFWMRVTQDDKNQWMGRSTYAWKKAEYVLLLSLKRHYFDLIHLLVRSWLPDSVIDQCPFDDYHITCSQPISWKSTGNLSQIQILGRSREYGGAQLGLSWLCTIRPLAVISGWFPSPCFTLFLGMLHSFYLSPSLFIFLLTSEYFFLKSNETMYCPDYKIMLLNSHA
jgi:hypothetical protein